MPRKKNGLPFEVHPSPMKADNGESLLYAKLRSGMKKTLQELEAYYSFKYSFRKGELVRLFDDVLDMFVEVMAEGYRIETPLGTFWAKLGMKRQITNPDDVRFDDVELQGIEFQFSKAFLKKLKIKTDSDGFRFVRQPTSSRIMRNMQHLEDALHKSLKANKGYTNVRSFSIYSGLTEYSARKVLNKWCIGNNPKLQRSRVSHAIIYTEI